MKKQEASEMVLNTSSLEGGAVSAGGQSTPSSAVRIVDGAPGALDWENDPSNPRHWATGMRVGTSLFISFISFVVFVIRAAE